MCQQDVPNLAGFTGDIPPPVSESSMCVYRLGPFVQIAALHLVLLCVLPLGLQNKMIAVLYPAARHAATRGRIRLTSGISTKMPGSSNALDSPDATTYSVRSIRLAVA